MTQSLVTPAQAGVPLPSVRKSGVPAFAGMTKWVVALLLLAFAVAASAQTFPERGLSPVVDQANLLNPEQERALILKSETLYKQTGRQFVVATVSSLEGRPIEDYGYRLGRAWRIGDEKRDDGVILLVAPKERKVRIETGYGARVFLTDAVSSVIIRNAILPRFKAGDMAGGIAAGADEIIKQMSLPPEQAQRNVQTAERAQQERREGSPGFLPVIFWVMIIGFVLLSFGRRAAGRRYRRGFGGSRRRKRDGGFDSGDLAIVLWGLSEIAGAASRGRGGGWGGGGWGGGGSWGGGGGFGGFSGGGGSFGGGGASGSW